MQLRSLPVGRLTLSEISGSLGDLGILIPLLVGMAHQGSVHFVPALFFAGLWNFATGLLWDVPMCVQPMKTIAAVALADGLSRVQVSLAGLLVAAFVLLLGLTRGVVVVNNAVPIAVVRGMQLGLGLSLARRGINLITDGEVAGFVRVLGGPTAGCLIGGGCFAAVLLCHRCPRVPIALLLFVFGLVLAALHVGLTQLPFDARPASPVVWALTNATGSDVTHALFAAALPQLPLTTLNSVVSVCRLSKDLFPSRPVSQTSVAVSVGLMNLIGCLFGAMPVCHGAGGLAAQHHFGARRGVSMLFLGSVKILLAITLGGATLALLDSFPNAVMGVLLSCAGLELAKAGATLQGEKEITIGLITAAATLTLKTGLGCLIGLFAAFAHGGYVELWQMIRDGELRSTLLHGTSQPLLSRYQPPDEPSENNSDQEELPPTVQARPHAAAEEVELEERKGPRQSPTAVEVVIDPRGPPSLPPSPPSPPTTPAAADPTPTAARPLRLSFTLNAGAKKGQAQSTALVAPVMDLVLAAAANKLRLKKKDVSRARLFVWGSGEELLSSNIESLLRNDDLIAVSVGEQYAGPVKAAAVTAAPTSAAAAAAAALVPAPQLTGSDDAGKQYESLAALWAEQAANVDAYNEANSAWWDADGYGGSTDDEAMIGDGGSEEDTNHSLKLLDELRANRPMWQVRTALDCGAGVGRVTKHVLLKRCESVCLLEPCEKWHKQSKRYLGKKRSMSCSFVHAKLEQLDDLQPSLSSYDLIWVQWTLQYLIDAHVVEALKKLKASLAPNGLMIVKENRPTSANGSNISANEAEEVEAKVARAVAATEQEESFFRVDTPSGPHARYDVTRPDVHHRWLFRCAGLRVEHAERCINGEVTAWALAPSGEVEELLEAPGIAVVVT